MYSKSGNTQQNFRDTASEVAGVDLSEWFVKAIDSTEELDFSEVGVLGVEVAELATESSDSKVKATEANNEESQKTAEEKNGDDDAQPAKASEKDQENESKLDTSTDPEDELDKPDPKPWIGVDGSASGDSMVVSSVTPDSPAYEAGIQTDDELIAVNDFRLNGGISGRLEQFEIGEPLEVLLSRRGELLRIKVTPAAKAEFDWSLKFVEEPNKQQERSQESWLGQ